MTVSEAINRSTVLVVSLSPINSVVVSRVVERMGLRAAAARPDGACDAIRSTNPGIVILDGGADDRDCDGLLGELERKRDETGGVFPSVLLLSTANTVGANPKNPHVVDMIIAKPLTVDRLQPAIDTLRARNGDFAGSAA